MKTIRYQMMSLALALLAVGCNDDEIAPDRHPANTGDEVQFGVALPGADTRTIYGEETETVFPVYWVNEDKVKVASPQCNIKEAEYQVTVNSAAQNYADNLTKTGDAGIQWGESETADFYSIYPSEGATFKFAGNTVTAELSVDATQYASITDKGTSYYAQPADMNNVVMYAKNAGVSKTSETVALQYTPFSTVIEFEINAPATATAREHDGIIIQTLTLTAPANTSIAGNFTFNFPATEGDAPSVSPATGGNNAITLHFLEDNQYKTTLSTSKQTLKAKMCLMPISGVADLKGWTVAVNTSVGTFSKGLGSNTGELKPGLVHKVKLPALSYANGEWVYNTNNWITSLPDYENIYLSELSLPGAWYAGSTESYQATTDMTTLWNAGVRAFAVECRSWTETKISGQGTTAPTRVCLSGSGRNQSGAYVNPMFSSATYISSIISSIAGAINADEYGVLVLSYADGGSGGHRELDHNYFIQGIANEITQANVTNIYADPITPNTTINDVLGKLIVKINVDNNIAKSSYGDNMNALLSYNPFLSQVTGEYDMPYYSTLYWKNWDDTYKSYSTDGTGVGDFVWCFSSANRTQTDTNGDTTIPSYSNRQTALSTMMAKSKQIYEASTHNVWFYFNAGGTQATSSTSGSPSPTAFASTMNNWLLETITSKTDASPLGIVMFNQCTSDTYSGPAIIKAIIEMNSKFYLKHAGDSSTGGETGQSDVQSSAPGFSSGVVDSNENAVSPN